jgi:hypothetical protein
MEAETFVETGSTVSPQPDRVKVARGVRQDTLDQTSTDSGVALIFHYVQVPHTSHARIVYVRVAVEATDAEQSLIAKCAEQDFPDVVKSIDAAFPFSSQAGDHAEPLADCFLFHRTQRGR